MSPVRSSNISETYSQHKISIDNVSVIKEIRKTNQRDAYEGIYIMLCKKKNAELMNGDEGNVRSILFDVPKNHSNRNLCKSVWRKTSLKNLIGKIKNPGETNKLCFFF
jgi:hypothetical protein